MCERIIWFPAMDVALRELRIAGLSVRACGVRIGVDYRVVTKRMDELGLPHSYGGQWDAWRRGERPAFAHE